jgi:hypothetical protein
MVFQQDPEVFRRLQLLQSNLQAAKQENVASNVAAANKPGLNIGGVLGSAGTTFVASGGNPLAAGAAALKTAVSQPYSSSDQFANAGAGIVNTGAEYAGQYLKDQLAKQALARKIQDAEAKVKLWNETEGAKKGQVLDPPNPMTGEVDANPRWANSPSDPLKSQTKYWEQRKQFESKLKPGQKLIEDRGVFKVGDASEKLWYGKDVESLAVQGAKVAKTNFEGATRIDTVDKGTYYVYKPSSDQNVKDFNKEVNRFLNLKDLSGGKYQFNTPQAKTLAAMSVKGERVGDPPFDPELQGQKVERPNPAGGATLKFTLSGRQISVIDNTGNINVIPEEMESYYGTLGYRKINDTIWSF